MQGTWQRWQAAQAKLGATDLSMSQSHAGPYALCAGPILAETPRFFLIGQGNLGRFWGAANSTNSRAQIPCRQNTERRALPHAIGTRGAALADFSTDDGLGRRDELTHPRWRMRCAKPGLRSETQQ